MTDEKWLEEAKKRAASKRGASWARFMAPGDEEPTDDETIKIEVGTTVEGIVLDLTEVVTKYGPTTAATIDDAEHGTLKILCGAGILKDLIAEVQVGDFISMEWLGMKLNKAGDNSYRNFDVSHVPAPGNERTPQRRVSVPAGDVPVMGEEDADLDDDL